jgi:hypothetical protein
MPLELYCPLVASWVENQGGVAFNCKINLVLAAVNLRDFDGWGSLGLPCQLVPSRHERHTMFTSGLVVQHKHIFVHVDSLSVLGAYNSLN